MADDAPATPLAKLAELTGAELRGDARTPIRGAAGIQHARQGDIALLAGARYRKFATTTQASALVVGPDFDAASTERPLLVAEDPEAAFEAISAHFSPPRGPEQAPGIHPTAVVDGARIDPTARVGAHCVVESGAVIGPRTILRPLSFVGRSARLGAECVLHPHTAVLERCVLGNRVVLHSGTVIGGDGFGYRQVDGTHQKIPQRGTVEIGDDVEIGANVTIDRARYGRTVIGRGTKIDNLVQVAHNVHVGEHSLLVAQAGIAGSTTLGHHVVLAAQAGLVDHIQIGDGAIVGAQAGVPRDVPPGRTVLGSPAQDLRNERRCMVVYQKLPDMAKEARALAKRVQDLEQQLAALERAEPDSGE